MLNHKFSATETPNWLLIKTSLIRSIVAAILGASHAIRRDFNEIEKLQISKKGTADFVSQADKRTEDFLIKALKKARPDFAIISEESGIVKPFTADSYGFIIDPIDGTDNFLHSLPHFCVSIGVVYCNKQYQFEPFAGVIYNPITDELFYAEQGKGAFLNQHKLQVSGRNNLEAALAATSSFGRKLQEDSFAIHLRQNLCKDLYKIRTMGAAALDLAWLAAGRFDLFWHTSLRPWDLAAGMAIISEAGGIITYPWLRTDEEINLGSSLIASREQANKYNIIFDSGHIITSSKNMFKHIYKNLPVAPENTSNKFIDNFIVTE